MYNTLNETWDRHLCLMYIYLNVKESWRVFLFWNSISQLSLKTCPVQPVKDESLAAAQSTSATLISYKSFFFFSLVF